jgi:two-component system, response regulator / RNA-binding antiterminator
VVDGLSAARLQPVIEVAIARFEEFQSLRHELEDARLKLADRRDVEKAKGLLMKRRGLDEPAAHELLRRMAMDRNLRIGDAARALLAAAELL